MSRALLFLSLALGVSCYPYHSIHAQGYSPGYSPSGRPTAASLLYPVEASLSQQFHLHRGELRHA